MSQFLVAALISSRICHDLTGPAGAVSNGVELLAEEDDPGMKDQSLELLAFSAAETSRRLQFYRLCFGAAGGLTAQTGIGEARRTAEGFFEGRKQNLQWPVSDIDNLRIPQTAVQLVLNLVLLAGEALPRGGEIQINLAEDGSRLEITGNGKNAGLREDDLAALSGENGPETLDARTVQPWYTAAIGREIGAEIVANQDGETLIQLTAGPVFSVSA